MIKRIASEAHCCIGLKLDRKSLQCDQFNVVGNSLAVLSKVKILDQILLEDGVSGCSIARSAPETVPLLEVLGLLLLLHHPDSLTSLHLLHHLTQQLVLICSVGDIVHLMPKEKQKQSYPLSNILVFTP